MVLGLAKFGLQTEYKLSDDVKISFKIPKNVTNAKSFISLLHPTEAEKFFDVPEISKSRISYFRRENPNLLNISEDDDGNVEGTMPFGNPGIGDWSICIFGGERCDRHDITMPCVNLGCVNITINDPTY